MILTNKEYTLEINDGAYEGEVRVEIQPNYDTAAEMFINKENAEKIVNHLITVFDITPEQRNK